MEISDGGTNCWFDLLLLRGVVDLFDEVRQLPSNTAGLILRRALEGQGDAFGGVLDVFVSGDAASGAGIVDVGDEPFRDVIEKIGPVDGEGAGLLVLAVFGEGHEPLGSLLALPEGLDAVSDRGARAKSFGFAELAGAQVVGEAAYVQASFEADQVQLDETAEVERVDEVLLDVRGGLLRAFRCLQFAGVEAEVLQKREQILTSGKSCGVVGVPSVECGDQVVTVDVAWDGIRFTHEAILPSSDSPRTREEMPDATEDLSRQGPELGTEIFSGQRKDPLKPFVAY
ncbi:hypothetical protein [Streptomyces nanshensis]|uniref:hypothetical protein n=1 Tax=Streptomyces nanshensis TaxID=518642 RepID=UPI00114C88F5|nr:hypothetical protein [Streptomyces nanshensis]